MSDQPDNICPVPDNVTPRSLGVRATVAVGICIGLLFLCALAMSAMQSHYGVEPDVKNYLGASLSGPDVVLGGKAPKYVAPHVHFPGEVLFISCQTCASHNILPGLNSLKTRFSLRSVWLKGLRTSS